ncbi:MAG: DNA-directed DNA polymerase II small subunit [Halobacteriales archaeon]|nr:DNA-directed DNA polymerase II small subunit [Halobacteriales archaeon]
MPLDTPARVARELARRGYNAEREAVTLLAGAPDPGRAIERAIEGAPEDAFTITRAHVRSATSREPVEEPARDTSPQSGGSPPETEGGEAGTSAVGLEAVSDGASESAAPTSGNGRTTEGRQLTIRNDMTGASTGTGAYEDFVAVFRDRYERLSRLLRGRVTHRPTSALGDMSGGGETAVIGMVSDIRSTTNGHWLVELEDTAGTFPCLLSKGSDAAAAVDQLLLDEVIAVQGRLSDDSGILFVDAVHFPDVPRTFEPSTADRHVQAALVSDLHVGSQEFLGDAWDEFAAWLHTEEAAPVEYLLIAGDMVEGVGVYPGQDEELDIVDLFEQYEAFAERLKAVPGDLDIVMIPGNHDAVRLAEPQPGFDEELRSIMSAHDAHIVSNPSTVELEGVSVLMYHGVSIDEVIAELPADLASYDEPHKAMYQLLRKRHVAPQFGERTRLAPEDRDYLVIDEVPDVFHAGHVHKLGTGRYHNVTVVNSGCWQAQTAFQRRVNIDPDAGYAPILDLDTLDVTIRKFT